MTEDWQGEHQYAEEWLADQFEEALYESEWQETQDDDVTQAVVTVVNMIPHLIKAIANEEVQDGEAMEQWLYQQVGDQQDEAWPAIIGAIAQAIPAIIPVVKNLVGSVRRPARRPASRPRPAPRPAPRAPVQASLPCQCSPGQREEYSEADTQDGHPIYLS